MSGVASMRAISAARRQSSERNVGVTGHVPGSVVDVDDATVVVVPLPLVEVVAASDVVVLVEVPGGPVVEVVDDVVAGAVLVVVDVVVEVVGAAVDDVDISVVDVVTSVEWSTRRWSW
jgi:hypothetical protein